MNYKPVLIILLVLNQSVFSSTIDTIPCFHTGFQVHYGFILPHSNAIEAVSHTKPFGFEISRNKLNTSYQSWKVFNTYWISGVQIRYFNFQNPKILGGEFDISFFAEPVISHGEKHLITVRGGGGFSYHTKIYDPVDNPSNQFFCTRISFPLYLNVLFKYKAADNIYLSLAGCYNHISNGGLKQPNYGMNFPTLALGLEYFERPIPDLKNDYSSDLKIVKPGIYMIIQTLSGYKVMDATDDYPEMGTFAFGFHARIAKQMTPFYSLNAGAEIILDGYIKETLRRDQSNIDYKRFALTTGQDFLLGNVIFTQYLGFYIYSPFKAKNSVYQKYEITYRIHKNFMLGVYLKAHTSTAELLGFCLNYRCFKIMK
ncbi:MAG: hypothetical protein C0408_01130 [Odoribacter sp.]|nr:hypothetical protein [Odoribacter sp.]